MNENKKSNKKKGGIPWIAIAVLVFGVIGQLADDGISGALVLLLPLIVFGVFLSRVIKAAKASQEKQNTAASPTPAAPVRRAPTPPTVKLHSDAKPHRDFSAPEAYCVVCENTGEDHLAFDRAQRLRQLDDWLKNGLIDRAEYRVLKETFEKNG